MKMTFINEKFIIHILILKKAFKQYGMLAIVDFA